MEQVRRSPLDVRMCVALARAPGPSQARQPPHAEAVEVRATKLSGRDPL